MADAGRVSRKGKKERHVGTAWKRSEDRAKCTLHTDYEPPISIVADWSHPPPTSPLSSISPDLGITSSPLLLARSGGGSGRVEREVEGQNLAGRRRREGRNSRVMFARRDARKQPVEESWNTWTGGPGKADQIE
eukprot:1818874-Rhodomonas_salina.1